VAVFCDGDFWHGRDWVKRRRKLKKGSNSSYWIAKLKANMARDKRHGACLQKLGWTVIRLWEKDILADPNRAAAVVAAELRRSLPK
jgi:DNA mismatch endonuclease (patch repair protein)